MHANERSLTARHASLGPAHAMQPGRPHRRKIVPLQRLIVEQLDGFVVEQRVRGLGALQQDAASSHITTRFAVAPGHRCRCMSGCIALHDGARPFSWQGTRGVAAPHRTAQHTSHHITARQSAETQRSAAQHSAAGKA